MTDDSRLIFICTCLPLQIATQVVGSLMALEAWDDKADIRVYINSSGRGLTYGLMQTFGSTSTHQVGLDVGHQG